jgi:flavin reductase (DIM6/NTAB) family NADH-FMN oxidoreductase RutF
MNKKILPLSKAYQLLEPGPVVMISSALYSRTNIMTMTWQTMIDFVPPIVGCVISDQNFSYDLITKSKECVINIPSVELAKEIVGVGNTTGAKVDKFKKFQLTPVPASIVKAPLIDECFANLECKVIDMRMAKQYNLIIMQVVKAWIAKSKKRYRTMHHCGNGVFVIDGTIIKLPSKKK